MSVALRDIKASARQRHDAEAAERDLQPWEHADAHLVLPRGSGPQRHDSSLTPFWRYWHELIRCRLSGDDRTHPGAHLIEQVYLVCGNQLGKTMGLLTVVLTYAAAVYPRATGLILDSLKRIRMYINGRLRPTFDRSSLLQELLPSGLAERRERLTSTMWQLATMNLYFLDGATAKDLRSLDLPLLLFDEFDVLPADVQGEGDPIRMALDRQKTHALIRLLVGITTPTGVDAHGWYRLCQGTNERLILRCLACPANWWLDPDYLHAPDDIGPDEIQRDDLAHWICPKCNRPHSTEERDRLIARASVMRAFDPAVGGWVPGTWETKQDGSQAWTPSADVAADGSYRDAEVPAGIVRSGWLNSLYSPFVTLGNFLSEERRCRRGSLEEYVAFRNGWRAEPVGDQALEIEAETIRVVTSQDRAYRFGRLPYAAAKYLVLTVDQQGIALNSCWFPWVLRAWSEDCTASWLVEAGGHKRECPLAGWDALEALLLRRWDIADHLVGLTLMTIDTANGPLTPDIRKWCACDQRLRRSLSGSGTLGFDNPYSVVRMTSANAAKMQGLRQAYYYNSAYFRNELAEWMRGNRGRWEIPDDAPQWYRDSLRSERQRVITERRRGRTQTTVVWEPDVITLPNGKTRERDDNHWWDVEVAQIAAVRIFGLMPGTTASQTGRRIVRRGIVG